MTEPKSRFSALKNFREQSADPQTNSPSPERTIPAIQNIPQTEAGKGRGRPTGKRSNPDFEPTTVLLRKKTKRSASRLLEDTNTDKDLSDLIESLLGEWISKHS